MNDEHQQMIDDIINRQSKLTEWEVGFIDSISDKDSLTEKQARKLEAIWERVTG